MPTTKPDRVPSRPPLTTRIRNSFELKRRLSSDGKRRLSSSSTADDTKPLLHSSQSHETTADSEALRDAVDKAINSEAFQAALAAKLARLVKPSIRDALDTLQPVIEAVVQHERLLRKVGGNVDDILVRMDDRTPFATTPTSRREEPSWPLVDDKHCGIQGQRPDEIVGVVRAHSGSLAEMVDGIVGIRSVLAAMGLKVAILQTSTEQSQSTLSAIQAQLDTSKAGIGEVRSALPSSLATDVGAIREHITAQDPATLSTHTDRLDTISNDVAALKGRADSVEKLEELSTSLESLKESIQAGITASDGRFPSLAPQITTILADLKGGDATSEILTAVQKSNKFHDAHAVALSELKDRDSTPVWGPDNTAALEAMAADIASLKEDITGYGSVNSEILAAVQNCNESLDAHAAILSELKERPLDKGPDHTTALEALTADIVSLRQRIEGVDANPEILAAVQRSNESHEARATILTELQERSLAPGPENSMESTAVLKTLAADLAALKEHMQATSEIHAAVHKSDESHEAHTAVLAELKERSLAPISTPDPTAALEALAADLTLLKEHIQAGLLSNTESVTTVGSKIDEVVSSLEAHRAADFGPSILEAVNKSNESHAGHAEALEVIKARDMAAAPVERLSSLEPQLTSIISTLELHSASYAAQTAAFESQNAALEGVKSVSVEPTTAMDLDTQLATIISTLESHSASHASHATALATHVAALERVRSFDSEPSKDLEPQFATIISTLESHSAAHTSHIASLESHASGLEAVRSLYSDAYKPLESVTELWPKLDSILNTLVAHTKCHASHAAALDSARSVTTAAPPVVNFSDLDPKLDSIINTIQSHTDPHTSHAVDFEGTSETSAKSDTSRLDLKLDTIVSTLEAHTAALSELKSGPANEFEGTLKSELLKITKVLETHTSILNEMKDDISAELFSHLHDIKDTHANHQTTLNEIREADVSEEILTALHSSHESYNKHSSVLAGIHDTVKALNDSQVAHTSLLEELNIVRPVEPAAENTEETGLGPILTTLANHTFALSGIRKATNVLSEANAAHAATLREIKDASIASNNFHAAHTFALGELRDLHVAHAACLTDIQEAVNTGRASSLDEIKAFQTVHEANLEELKSTVAAGKDLHTGHAVSLDELKALHQSHATTLEGCKAAESAEPAKVDLSTFEDRLAALAFILELQNSTLLSIKDVATSPEVLKAIKNSHETANDILLNTTQAASTHEAILAFISSLKSDINIHASSLQEPYNSTQTSHSDLTADIAGLAIGGVPGGTITSRNSNEDNVEDKETGVNRKVLAEIQIVKAILERTAAQVDVNHYTITTLNEQLKNEIRTSGMEIKECIAELSGEAYALESVASRVTEVPDHRDGVLSELVSGGGENCISVYRDVSQYEVEGSEIGTADVGEPMRLQAVTEGIEHQALTSALERYQRKIEEFGAQESVIPEHCPVENTNDESAKHDHGNAALAAGLSASTLAAGGLGMAVIHEGSDKDDSAVLEIPSTEGISEEEVGTAKEIESASDRQLDNEPDSSLLEIPVSESTEPVDQCLALENESGLDASIPDAAPETEHHESIESDEVSQSPQVETQPAVDTDLSNDIPSGTELLVDNSGEPIDEVESAANFCPTTEGEVVREAESQFGNHPVAEEGVKTRMPTYGTDTDPGSQPIIESHSAVDAEPESGQELMIEGELVGDNAIAEAGSDDEASVKDDTINGVDPPPVAEDVPIEESEVMKDADPLPEKQAGDFEPEVWKDEKPLSKSHPESIEAEVSKDMDLSPESEVRGIRKQVEASPESLPDPTSEEQVDASIDSPNVEPASESPSTVVFEPTSSMKEPTIDQTKSHHEIGGELTELSEASQEPEASSDKSLESSPDTKVETSEPLEPKPMVESDFAADAEPRKSSEELSLSKRSSKNVRQGSISAPVLTSVNDLVRRFEPSPLIRFRTGESLTPVQNIGQEPSRRDTAYDEQPYLSDSSILAEEAYQSHGFRHEENHESAPIREKVPQPLSSQFENLADESHGALTPWSESPVQARHATTRSQEETPIHEGFSPIDDYEIFTSSRNFLSPAPDREPIHRHKTRLLE